MGMAASGAEIFDAAVAREDAAPDSDRRSLARGLSLFTLYGVLYFATLIDAIAPFPLVLNVLSGICNGICIAMLFIVAPDCCHGALVPRPPSNPSPRPLAF